jgi:hypothetical protein
MTMTGRLGRVSALAGRPAVADRPIGMAAARADQVPRLEAAGGRMRLMDVVGRLTDMP